MIWIIKGKNLPTLEIIADSFDEALEIAKKIYSVCIMVTIQVVKRQEK